MIRRKKKIYNVGIVGLGRIASLLEEDPLRGKPATHAGAFDRHPRTQLVSGCDLDPERCDLFNERWCVKRVYTDYLEMFKKEKLDIVSVAAWTENHSEIVVAAVEAGVWGIYCEKPIALNLTQAKKMIKACEDAGVAMVVGHERRWDWRFRMVRDLIESGEIGQLRAITGYALSGAPPKLSRRKHGGGAMFHDGTHLIDLINFYAGQAESVIGLVDRPDGGNVIERTALGIINYENGVRAMVMGGGERKYFHFELDIQTDEARILIGNHITEIYKTQPSRNYSGFMELGQVGFPKGGEQVNAFVGGVSELIKEMETGKPSVSSGRDGYRAMEVIMALYRSADKDGALVRLPLR